LTIIILKTYRFLYCVPKT